MNLEVDNQSRRAIKTVQVGFQRDWVYHAGNQSKREQEVFGMISLPSIPPKTKHQANVPLQVPAVNLPSVMTVGSCQIIEINYHVRLVIKAEGLTRSKILTIPVVMGYPKQTELSTRSARVRLLGVNMDKKEA
jgi:hypothetical protein